MIQEHFKLSSNTPPLRPYTPPLEVCEYYLFIFNDINS